MSEINKITPEQIEQIGAGIRKVAEQMLRLQETMKHATVAFRDFERRREIRERQR